MFQVIMKPLIQKTLQKEIDATNKAELELKKADKAIATLEGTPADAEVLSMVANHQKQVVMMMSGGNPEDAIAIVLAQGIEAYAKQLEIIKGWTTPGLPMFESAMAVMFEGIKNSGNTSGYALEDLFQLAIMDFMSHGYGGSNRYEDQMRHFWKVLALALMATMNIGTVLSLRMHAMTYLTL